MLRSVFHRASFGALLACTCLTTAHAADVSSLGANNTLVTVDSTAPTTVKRSLGITGVGTGETLLGIDARPATSNRALYSISNTGQLYSINSITGAATAIGTPISQVAGAAGAQLGIDFNPTVDRLRVVTSTGVNLRVNPNDGTVLADTNLSALGVGGAAYTNSVAGATTTTLYVINPATGTLSIQAPPNAGVLTPVGALGVAAPGNAGFDIQTTGTTNDALATLTSAGGTTSLYRVNLTTGAATLLGTFGAGGSFNGLAFTPAAFAANASLTPNQLAVAQTLDAFTGAPSAGLLTFLTTLDALPSDADRAAAFSQLGPNGYSILPDAVLQTNEFVDSTLRRYLRDMRGGGVGNDDPTATTGSDRPIGGFLVGTGRTGQFKARGDRDKVDYGSSGVIAGIDFRLNPTTLIGVTGGYELTDVRINPISPNSNAKTWFVGGYGTVGIGPFFIDLAGTYGESDFDLRRNTAFTGFSSAATADTDARYWSISGTTGLSFDMGGFELEPYGGARYVDVKVDGFSEGLGLTDLTVGDQDIESLQSIAGLRVGADYKMLGASVRPYVWGEWRHEFKNDDSRIVNASFGGTGISTPFAYTTSPLGNDYAVAGAGLTVSGGGPLSLVLDYTGQFWGGYEIHGVQAGARLSF
jgi:uncharacterized protein with beta-barrel porin domain